MASPLDNTSSSNELSQVVEGAVSEIVQDAQKAIEDAEEKAENAVEVAEIIGQAALQSEFGRRIETIERSVEQWQDRAERELSEMRQSIESLNQTLQVIQTILPTPLPEPLAEPTAEPSSSSQEILEIPTIQPEEIPNNRNGAEENPVSRTLRKIRRLI